MRFKERYAKEKFVQFLSDKSTIMTRDEQGTYWAFIPTDGYKLPAYCWKMIDGCYRFCWVVDKVGRCGAMYKLQEIHEVFLGDWLGWLKPEDVYAVKFESEIVNSDDVHLYGVKR